MKTCYRAKSFKASGMALIEACDRVIVQYMGQGLRLTLRQLYYQLVTQNIIPNEERSYKNLGNLVSDARLAGLLDWDAIEDRGREPDRPPEFESLSRLIEVAIASYRLPRWKGQEHYVELWVEKQALAGVLEPLAREFHVTLMVNKGYSSQSAMRASALRYIDAQERYGQAGICFYLGDHDPSGNDMVRDIDERLEMFGAAVDVRKLALTMTQIKQFNPPPNPAKITDSRAAAYIEEFGPHSWEVDALNPTTLARIIRTAFRSVLNTDLMDAVRDREARDKNRLRGLTETETGEGEEDEDPDGGDPEGGDS